MRRHKILRRLSAPALLLLILTPIASAQVPSLDQWEVHDMERAQPPMVTPGVAMSAPSDAIVLFEGADISQWRHLTGKPASWTVTDGYMEVARATGPIVSREGFGDVQLHIEWATPNSGEGQDSGNSGVFLMGIYEVQVLNSHGNVTYPDGQAGSVYGQYPPLVNASRPAGEWQSYDIIFRRPRFNADESLLRPARATVLHNGVLVQDAVVLTGPTSHRSRPAYEAHADRLPIMLQDHGEPTRFRNIWVRELPDDM